MVPEKFISDSYTFRCLCLLRRFSVTELEPERIAIALPRGRRSARGMAGRAGSSACPQSRCSRPRRVARAAAGSKSAALASHGAAHRSDDGSRRRTSQRGPAAAQIDHHVADGVARRRHEAQAGLAIVEQAVVGFDELGLSRRHHRKHRVLERAVIDGMFRFQVVFCSQCSYSTCPMR